MLTIENKNLIRKQALLTPDEEICGLIGKSNNIYSIYFCKNISNNKKTFFILDPLDYIKISNSTEIVGMFHSQYLNVPSLLDNFSSEYHNIYSIVYCIESDKFYIIEPKLKDYLNKNFKIGEYDCLELLINYYKYELGISITNLQRDDNWTEFYSTKVINLAINSGFSILDKEERQKHDLLFFGKDVDNIYHFGIYLGNNLFLHHPRNGKSVIEYLNNHHLNNIIGIGRHKNVK